MKKVLLGICALLFAMSVNASTGTKIISDSIEEVKVTVKESVSYNENLEVPYVINPQDIENAKLTWSISGLKEDITVEFVNGNTTNIAKGTITLKIENTLDKDVVLKLTATQDGKVLSTTEFNVESKESTLNKTATIVKDLISSLDEKINKQNYEENREALDEIEKELKKNPEAKELLKDDILAEYNDAAIAVDTYENNQNKTFTIVISVVLVLIFLAGMFLIFKKEEK